MIVEFTRLAFTTGTNLRIEAHINPSDWYKNCTIKKVTIDTDKTVRAGGPSDEPIYSEDVTGIVTDAGKTLITNIDLTNILCDPADRMLFVYIEIDGAPSESAPCEEQNPYSMKAVVNFEKVYRKALNLMKCTTTCGCSDDGCSISTQFANFALEYYRLVTSIEVGKNTEALESFNVLLGNRINTKTVFSNCGCNGN